MKRGCALPAVLLNLIVFIFGGSARAQTYTLDDCLKIALEKNYTVLAARNSYDASKVNVYSAWGDLLPSISLSTSASRSWAGYSFSDPIDGRQISGGVINNTYSGALSLSQNYSGLGLYNYAAIKQSVHVRNSSFSSLAMSRNSLVLEVKSGFFELLKTKMLLDVSTEAVKRGEERLRVVQSKYDLGSASMSDVLKAKVQFGNDRLDLVSKSNAYKLARANLAYTMGIDVNQEFEVDSGFHEWQVDMEFPEALNRALANNPEYSKARFDYFAAADEKLIAYSRFLPALSLRLTHSTSPDQFSSLTDPKRSDASYYMSASLSFNIFNGVSDYAYLNSARKNLNSKDEYLKNAKNSVALELKQAFLDLDRSSEARKLADESVAAAKEDLNLVKEKYNLGAATILEILDAEVSYKQSQTNQVQALFDYNLAAARLEKTLGR